VRPRELICREDTANRFCRAKHDQISVVFRRLSTMAFLMLAGRSAPTSQRTGFRDSVRELGREETNTPRTRVEAGLAHIGYVRFLACVNDFETTVASVRCRFVVRSRYVNSVLMLR